MRKICIALTLTSILLATGCKTEPSSNPQPEVEPPTAEERKLPENCTSQQLYEILGEPRQKLEEEDGQEVVCFYSKLGRTFAYQADVETVYDVTYAFETFEGIQIGMAATDVYDRLGQPDVTGETNEGNYQATGW